jgi:hypothetical protein
MEKTKKLKRAVVIEEYYEVKNLIEVWRHWRFEGSLEYHSELTPFNKIPYVVWGELTGLPKDLWSTKK